MEGKREEMPRVSIFNMCSHDDSHGEAPDLGFDPDPTHRYQWSFEPNLGVNLRRIIYSCYKNYSPIVSIPPSQATVGVRKTRASNRSKEESGNWGSAEQWDMSRFRVRSRVRSKRFILL